MTAIIGTYGRTLIFLGLSVPWHSKPTADSPPSHPFFFSLFLIVPLVFSVSIPLFLSLFLSPFVLRPECAPCTPLPVEPPPCDGTRPLLIINISRTRSAGKSPARPILCGLWRWGVVIEIETFEHTQRRVPLPRHTHRARPCSRDVARARTVGLPSVGYLHCVLSRQNEFLPVNKRVDFTTVNQAAGCSCSAPVFALFPRLPFERDYMARI